MRNLCLSIAAIFLIASVYCFAAVPITTADIGFSFIAGGKTYPAGTYRFAMNESETEMMIEGVKPATASGMVPILTRLAARERDEAAVVFDVVGNDHYLSEIYMPNMDGFYFKSAPAKHTHTTVKVSKSKGSKS